MDQNILIPAGVLRTTTEFLRAKWPKIVAVSAVVLVPCFWHRRLEAGDLGSHVYNAWLVQLIEHHEVSGLWIAHQHTNVLFDLLLSALAKVAGLQMAAHIVVAASVLAFFWGTFALVSAVSGRAPWNLLPLIAMVCYGWTFNMGFCNYYIALALSFISLAIMWRGNNWERAAALGLVPLILLAHPLGLVWLGGGALYVLVADRVSRRYQLVAFALALMAIVAVHKYLWAHFVVLPKNHPFYLYNGTDQLVLFGPLYRVLAIAVSAIIVVAIAIDLIYGRDRKNLWRSWGVPLQLNVLVFVAVGLLPDSIQLPQYQAPLSLLSSRLTSVSAVLVCCLAGVMYPRKWHIVGLGAIAVVFFSLLYVDTGRVNRVEEQAEHLISMLPPRQRVIVTIADEPRSRLTLEHVVDSACIDHCFTYSNYEASTGQFRVRALPGNHIVTTEQAEMREMYYGTYRARPSDLPMYQIYVCRLNDGDEQLCIRQLTAGSE